MSFVLSILPFILIWLVILSVQEVTGNPWVRNKLTDTGLSVTLYGVWQWKNIPYASIVEIRKATLFERIMGWLIFITVDRITKTPVTIVWKSAALRKYVMSPANPDEFIAEVKRRMNSTSTTK